MTPLWITADQKHAGTGNTAAFNLSVPAPDNISIDDLLVITVWVRNDASTVNITPPDGWALHIHEPGSGGSMRPQMAVYWKIAELADETASDYFFSFNISVSRAYIAGRVIDYDPDNIFGNSSSVYVADSDTFTVPSIDSLSGNLLLSFAGASRTGGGITWESPVEMDAKVLGSISGSGAIRGWALATEDMVSDGATGDRTWKDNNASINNTAVLFDINGISEGGDGNELVGSISGGGLISGIVESPLIAPSELTGAIMGGGSISGTLTSPALDIPEIIGIISGGGILSGVLESPDIQDSELLGSVSGSGLIEGIIESPSINVNELTGLISGGGIIEGVVVSPAVVPELTGVVTGGGGIGGSLVSPQLSPSELVGSVTGGGALRGIFQSPNVGESEFFGLITGGGSPHGILDAPSIDIHEFTGSITGNGSINGILESPEVLPKELIGIITGGGSIVGGEIEQPEIEVNEITGLISGNGIISGIFEFQTLLPNLENHIVMAESQFKVIASFISPIHLDLSNKVVFTVTEKSTSILLLKFFNINKEPVSPELLHYKIDCDNHQIKELTEIADPGEEVTIEITPEENDIFKDHGIEQHVITIKIVHDGGRRMNIERAYNVYPLKFLEEQEEYE